MMLAIFLCMFLAFVSTGSEKDTLGLIAATLSDNFGLEKILYNVFLSN